MVVFRSFQRGGGGRTQKQKKSEIDVILGEMFGKEYFHAAHFSAQNTCVLLSQVIR